MPDIMSFSPLWGIWHITKHIGSGTFGDVYEAKRAEMGREYVTAIKHIPILPKGTTLRELQAEGKVTDEASAQRYCQGLLDTLVKEIDICHELKGYTNFVSYEDHMIVPRQNEIGYDVFIRMELLTSLSDYIADNGITVGGITKLCEDMCEALTVLERKRIIHRDIKPANIFVNTNGDFKLGDFGVARHMEGVSSVTVKGTYNYMAPEISKNEAAGPNADLYSLGILLYRLLNYNRAPFLPPPPTPVTHDADQAALERRFSGAQMPLPARNDLSLALTNVIMRACEYRPADRYQTAEEMKSALRRFREDERRPVMGTARMLDSDATVAVERNQTQIERGPGVIFDSSRMGHNSINGPGTGFTFGENPPPKASNKLLFAVIFSVIGLFAIMLVVILVLLLPERENRGQVVAEAPPTITLVQATPSRTPSTPYIPPTPLPTPIPTPPPTPTPIPSSLTIREYTLPPGLKVGKIFEIKGIVVSNYRILSITGRVYDSDGHVEQSKTVYPNEYSYNINADEFDDAIYFDHLKAGDKIYEIEATDEMGTKVLINSPFTVSN